MFIYLLTFIVALWKLSSVDGQNGTPGDDPGQEMDNCACEVPTRTDKQRLCSADINFLTHLQLFRDGNPRCHDPTGVDPSDERCMSVVYTFESTKVGGITIDISTPRQAPGCELVPQQGVKYAISGTQFQKDVVDCGTINAADVVFIVDESSSIGSETFQNVVKPFLIDIKNVLAPTSGVSLVNFGALTFATTPRIQFPLQSGRTSEQIGDLIDAIDYVGGGTFLGDALALAASGVLVAPFDTDPNPNICIFLGDGNGKGGISVESGAAQLKNKCPTIFAIGVGSRVDQVMLELIATDPDKAILVADFDALTRTLAETIKQSICTPTGEKKKVCSVKNCMGIFRETDHDEFNELRKIYNDCQAA